MNLRKRVEGLREKLADMQDSPEDFIHIEFALQEIDNTLADDLETSARAECAHKNTHMRGWTQVCDDCGQGRDIG